MEKTVEKSVEITNCKKPGTNVVYHVEWWNATIVARWEDPEELWQEFMGKVDAKLGDSIPYRVVANILYEPFIASAKNMRGIARCMPDDEFDIEVGKKIALKKLKQKLRMAHKRVLKNLTYEFLNLAVKTVEMFDGKQKVEYPFVLTYLAKSKHNYGATIELLNGNTEDEDG